MAVEIAFENGRISNFQGLVTLTLDRIIVHTITHRHLPTCQISLKSKKLFVDGWTYVRTSGRTFDTDFIRSTQKNRPKNRYNKFKMADSHHFETCDKSQVKVGRNDEFYAK